MKFLPIRMHDDNEHGFTLIELLVVILIIGILAAIAVPMFLNQRKAAVDASIKSDVKNAALVIETGITKYPQTRCVSRPNYPVNGILILRFHSEHNNGNNTCGGEIFGTLESRTSQGNNILPMGNPHSEEGYTVRGWNPDANYHDPYDPEKRVDYVSGEGGIIQVQ